VKIKKKKRKKVTPYRKLYLQAERLWKECAFIRDGRICQVQKECPQITTEHSRVLQVDHCITRGDKNFFFDVRNSTVVCSNCNLHKKNRFRGIDYAIQKIVMDRESAESFGMMMEVHQSGVPNLHFKKVWWIEEVIQSLKNYKSNYETSLKIINQNEKS
jgi:hypothetical protein